MTARKPCCHNGTLPQVRRLLDVGEVLVVEACKVQPDFEVTRVAIGRDGTAKFFGELMGNRHYLDYDQIAPYAPGDVVPVRESFYIDLPDGDLYSDEEIREALYYRADGTCCEQIPECECASVGQPKWLPANRMPLEFIRLRPVVKSVECRRVNSITDEESQTAAFGETRDGEILLRPYGTFQRAWHRRYARRGEAYSFEKSWAWFRVLKLEG